MPVRIFLIIVQPILFLVICISVYVITGVGAILYAMAFAFFVIFTVSGIVIMVRRGVARCVHIDDQDLVVERRWPWDAIQVKLSEAKIHHVGAKFYRIEANDESISFDKSVCTCMSEEAFKSLCEQNEAQYQ